MITTLALVLALAPQIAHEVNPGQAKTLLAEKGMSYTGRNGYEDYLMAAEVARDPDLGIYLLYCSSMTHKWELGNRNSGDFATKGDSPVMESTPLAEHLKPMTPLAVKREMVAKYGKVFDWIRVGNTKTISIFDPSWNMETLFPELSHFKSIAKFLRFKADVSIADGNSAEATSTWREGLEFADQISRGGTLIHSLVGIANRSIFLAGINDAMSTLSLRDYGRLQDFAKQLGKREPSLIGGFRGEEVMAKTFALKDLTQMMANSSSEYDSPEFAATRREIAAFAKLPANEQEAILQRVRQRVLTRHQELIATLKKPECEWFSLKPDKFETMEDQIAGLMLPVFEQAFSAEAKSRTQMRLLRLHCLIESHRLEQGEYPSDLSPFPADATYDPATKGPFDYAKKGAGYELASKGWGDVGRVHLRYVRPSVSPAQMQDSNPPPH